MDGVSEIVGDSDGESLTVAESEIDGVLLEESEMEDVSEMVATCVAVGVSLMDGVSEPVTEEESEMVAV
jgi:hypothetical protein